MNADRFSPIQARAIARLLAAALLVVAATAKPSAAAPPLPGVRGVMLVSVDGLRPDLALRADTPVLHALMARGSFTSRALTTPLAITLPSHVSMVTGVTPATHGVLWNGDRPPGPRNRPARPTLFELAKRDGYRTAMASGKSKFVTLAVPGSLDRWYVPLLPAVEDDAVTDTAVRWLAGLAPQVLFVHLPGVDVAGHTYGWGSKQQMEAIARADQCIGRLLDELQRRSLLDSTVVLVTADHGGAGKSHGPGDERSLRIPWIIAGPGIRQGFDLAQDSGLVVHTEDTFATLCDVLGIEVPGPIDGHVVDTVFVSPRHRTPDRRVNDSGTPATSNR